MSNPGMVSLTQRQQRPLIPSKALLSLRRCIMDPLVPRMRYNLCSAIEECKEYQEFALSGEHVRASLFMIRGPAWQKEQVTNGSDRTMDVHT